MNLLHPRFLLLAALGAVTAQAHSHEGEPHFETTEIVPGIYMMMGVGGFTGGNIGISVGEDGVVMIDDSMPPFLDKLQYAIADITDRPVDFLINTHYHGDHTGNNAAMSDLGVHLVGHDQLRARLADDAETEPGALPVITFATEMTFHLNGQTARLIHTPAAHTDGDALIHFIEANVIHAGDTFFHRLFPYIDLDAGGSVAGYIAAQEMILRRCDDETKIIPGHGPLASQADLARDLAMLKHARDLVAALVAADHSEDAIVAANPLADYHDDYNWGFITTERMTRTLVQDIVGKETSE